MKIEDIISDEKTHYHINRLLSLLSSDKINKYEYYQYYLLLLKVLPSNQTQMIEQAKYTYSLLDRALKNKQRNDVLKTFDFSSNINELKSIFPQNQMNILIINKLKQTKELQNNSKLEDLEYTTKRRKY